MNKPNNCNLKFECIDWYNCAYNNKNNVCKHRSTLNNCKNKIAQVNAAITFLKQNDIKIHGSLFSGIGKGKYEKQ